MAGGRNITPLFDLLGNKASTTSKPGASPRAAASSPSTSSPSTSKPIVRIELKPGGPASTSATPSAASLPKPNPAPEPPTSPSPDEIATPPQHWFSPLGGNSTVRLPAALLYTMLFIFVVVVIFAWIAGASVGRSAAEKESSRLLRRDVGQPTDPLNQPNLPPSTASVPQVNPAAVPATTQIGSAAPADTSTAVAPKHSPDQAVVSRPSTVPIIWTDPPPPGAAITSKGFLSGDPRESGKNYLALANLGLEDTKEAIQFLVANGVDAFAVPVVDRGRGAANNPPPSSPNSPAGVGGVGGGGVYRIFALPGITSEQYSRKMTIRTNLEAKVASIGKTWQEKHRGASNFARTNWEKFQ